MELIADKVRNIISKTKQAKCFSFNGDSTLDVTNVDWLTFTFRCVLDDSQPCSGALLVNHLAHWTQSVPRDTLQYQYRRLCGANK